MSQNESLSVMNARMAVLRLERSSSVDGLSIIRQAAERIGNSSSWIPMVIDASEDVGGIELINQQSLVNALRGHGIILIGWYFGNRKNGDGLKLLAKSSGLVVFSSLSSIDSDHATDLSQEHEEMTGKSDDEIHDAIVDEVALSHLASPLPSPDNIDDSVAIAVVLDGRLRSGQQLRSDASVIVNGNTHSGSEVYANKDIHIKGHCDGALFAGVLGDKKAQIRCSKFRASLISIAGSYQIYETFPPEVIGKSIIIELKNDEFVWRLDPNPSSIDHASTP